MNQKHMDLIRLQTQPFQNAERKKACLCQNTSWDFPAKFKMMEKQMGPSAKCSGCTLHMYYLIRNTEQWEISTTEINSVSASCLAAHLWPTFLVFSWFVPPFYFQDFGSSLLSLLWIFKKLFICLFIYLFLAVLGLRCCARAFSNCSKWGLLFHCSAGFSLRWLLLSQSMGSRHTGFSSCGTWAQ